MAERTIDLRHQEPLPPKAPAPPQKRAVSRAPTPPPAALTPHFLPKEPQARQTKNLLEWTAPEYPAVERGPYWWMPPSVGALAFVLFGILVKSYLFAAFAGLALLVALLYVRRPPRAYRFAISPEGVYIGETRHRFSDLESFWIFEHGEQLELSLETKKGRIFPYLALPLGDVHPNRIRQALSDFLPEKEHAELFTDQIARSIGF